jgi:hypothetical protein
MIYNLTSSKTIHRQLQSFKVGFSKSRLLLANKPSFDSTSRLVGYVDRYLPAAEEAIRLQSQSEKSSHETNKPLAVFSELIGITRQALRVVRCLDGGNQCVENSGGYDLDQMSSQLGDLRLIIIALFGQGSTAELLHINTRLLLDHLIDRIGLPPRAGFTSFATKNNVVQWGYPTSGTPGGRGWPDSHLVYENNQQPPPHPWETV